MNKKHKQPNENRLLLLYDKECPLCNRFAKSVDGANAHIEIINGRDQTVLRQKASEEGFNIDRGSVLYHKHTFFFADEALLELAKHAHIKSFTGTICRLLVKFPRLAKPFYSTMLILRRLLLKIRNKPLINEKQSK